MCPRDKGVEVEIGVTVKVGGGQSVMATGVAQMLTFAAMQTFSVTVAGAVMGFGAV